MSLFGFCEWLANTPWSIALHESRWAYSIIESVHVLSLCLFLGMAVMLDLRLLGVTMRRAAVSEVVRQLLPWTAAGFVLMVISGMLLFSAIPVRTFQNIFFRLKMVLLISAGLNVWVFHSTVYRKVAVWAGIVIAGRMIAYNWFDCDKPQRAIIILAAGCRTDSR